LPFYLLETYSKRKITKSLKESRYSLRYRLRVGIKVDKKIREIITKFSYRNTIIMWHAKKALYLYLDTLKDVLKEKSQKE
jgi:hypothetical protein